MGVNRTTHPNDAPRSARSAGGKTGVGSRVVDGKPKIITKAYAVKHGLNQFFTGEPCNNGHVSGRYVSDGKCVECRAEIRRKRRQDIKRAERRPDDGRMLSKHEGYSHDEIAVEIGVSRQRVAQIEQEALSKLCAILTAQGYSLGDFV